MTWHTGRTVGVTLYKGEAKADMVGVMVGPHDAACDLAALVVKAVNGRPDLTTLAELLEASRCMLLWSDGMGYDGPNQRRLRTAILATSAALQA